MRHAANRRHKNGQSLVLALIALPVLIAATSLGVDLAIFYFNWSELQKAADSAALAGASYLPANPTKAVAVGTQYAQLNGVKANEISSVAVSPNAASLTLVLSREVSFYFARIVGITQRPVAAKAVATAETLGSATGPIPIGINYLTTYTYGAKVTLQEGYGPGNWGALALGGPGASIYLNNLENGYSGTIAIGDTVTTETGVINGPTQTGINARLSAGLASDPSGTFSDHVLSDPRTVTVPMVDFSNVKGNSEVPVKGFAELWLVGADGKGDITAYFIMQVAAGTPSPSAANYGGYQVALVQ